jgi:uncharacterized BrkB/YihY/UPF0761 family membrane protein
VHARASGGNAVRKGREWVERQDPGTRPGVAITAWRRYRALDGPLQSLLLSVYMVLAVLPALLVIDEYLHPRPAALANHLVDRYGLSATTASLLRGVLVQGRTHELGSALLAIAGALIFGLGFGRVLQHVYTRLWGITVQARWTDQLRYAGALVTLYALICVVLLQANKLDGAGRWTGLAVAPGWVALVAIYFVVVPRSLTHGQLKARDLLPGAALTGLELVLLMLLSARLMEPWIDFYAKDYGGFGVVMAIFFWFGLGTFLVVATACLGRVLVERRALRG